MYLLWIFIVAGVLCVAGAAGILFGAPTALLLGMTLFVFLVACARILWRAFVDDTDFKEK